MVVAEEIRSSRPCFGAAVAGTGCGRRGMTGGSGSSVREEQSARGLSEGGECWASGSARARKKRGEREPARERGKDGPSVAHAGKGEERELEGGREGEVSGPAWPMRERGKGRGELGWPRGLGCFISFFFSFSFLYSNIQTKLFEFK
jgi:hypothetical protein